MNAPGLAAAVRCRPPLATRIVRRRRPILIGALIVAALAGAYGGGVADKLSNGGFDDPRAEATRAGKLVEKRFGGGTPNLVLLVTAADGSVDSDASAAAGRALSDRLRAEAGIAQVVDYWTLAAPPLRSRDGSAALVLARIAGSEDDVRERVNVLSPRYRGASGAVSVEVTGQAEVFRQVGTTIEHDLKRAETLALPITLVLLVLIFGGLVAASLPLLVGAITVISTFAVLTLLSTVTDVSIFALNLTTAMGLGLAIDYALFIVSRYREELAAGWPVLDAVARTIRTAGRTVVFSAATVAISLSSLLLFRQAFLRSFAYAGIAVSMIAALVSAVVLPALLAMLGTRVGALRIRRHRRAAVGAGAASVGDGAWHRIAMAVMRRPVRVLVAAGAALLVLGTPFLGIKLSLSDHRVLPKAASARVALDRISTAFGSRENGAAEVVLADWAAGSAPSALASYASALSAVPGVARVDFVDGSALGGSVVVPASPASDRFRPSDGAVGTWLSVVPSIEPVSPAGERLVRDLRAVPAPSPVLIGGPSADLVDAKASLFARLPWAAAFIAVVTFVLLFLMFGGLLVPVKALILNVLSLSATFGGMVWIFQEGHLASVLGFTPTGALDATTPVLMFCIAFGLSMDYEVFLLSRIKEEHDRTGDNTASVAVGLERTGRIVTAAGLLIAVVFIAFATSGIAFIKLLGLGLATAVLIDAFVIRATLVPASMRLAGEANWWAPALLRRLQQRIGLSEHVELDDRPPLATP